MGVVFNSQAPKSHCLRFFCQEGTKLEDYVTIRLVYDPLSIQIHVSTGEMLLKGEVSLGRPALCSQVGCGRGGSNPEPLVWRWSGEGREQRVTFGGCWYFQNPSFFCSFLLSLCTNQKSYSQQKCWYVLLFVYHYKQHSPGCVKTSTLEELSSEHQTLNWVKVQPPGSTPQFSGHHMDFKYLCCSVRREVTESMKYRLQLR